LPSWPPPPCTTLARGNTCPSESFALEGGGRQEGFLPHLRQPPLPQDRNNFLETSIPPSPPFTPHSPSTSVLTELLVMCQIATVHVSLPPVPVLCASMHVACCPRLTDPPCHPCSQRHWTEAQRRDVKGLSSGRTWGVYHTEEGTKGEEEGGIWTQVVLACLSVRVSGNHSSRDSCLCSGVPFSACQCSPLVLLCWHASTVRLCQFLSPAVHPYRLC
jgi:hypothetical protein